MDWGLLRNSGGRGAAPICPGDGSGGSVLIPYQDRQPFAPASSDLIARAERGSLASAVCATTVTVNLAISKGLTYILLQRIRQCGGLHADKINAAPR